PPVAVPVARATFGVLEILVGVAVVAAPGVELLPEPRVQVFPVLRVTTAAVGVRGDDRVVVAACHVRGSSPSGMRLAESYAEASAGRLIPRGQRHFPLRVSCRYRRSTGPSGISRLTRLKERTCPSGRLGRNVTPLPSAGSERVGGAGGARHQPGPDR